MLWNLELIDFAHLDQTDEFGNRSPVLEALLQILDPFFSIFLLRIFQAFQIISALFLHLLITNVERVVASEAIISDVSRE